MLLRLPLSLAMLRLSAPMPSVLSVHQPQQRAVPTPNNPLSTPPARRQAIASKKGISYSEFNNLVDGEQLIDHILILDSEPNWTFGLHALHCQR